MDTTQKLFSDIEKLKKHYRAEHSNQYDGEEVCRKIASLFETSNRSLQSIAASFADYWFTTYIQASGDIRNEPSEDNLDRLAALQALLEGSTENTDCLAKQDWKELCELVSAEAEDLPLDALNYMMAIFVDRQSF